MPPLIRTLVVADPIAFRRCVADALSIDEGIDVVGTAANGKIGLLKLNSLHPDVVTIAPELAGDNALEMVRSIRQSHPRVPVIAFGPSRQTFQAVLPALMKNGLSAYVSTPADAGREALGLRVRDALIPKIKALCTRPLERLERVDILAIGISTGGPNALPVLLSKLPADFPIPVVMVQHMPPVFTRRLAERLTMKCPLGVTEAASGEELRAGHVWLAPGDHHLTIIRKAGVAHLEIDQGPPENSCRPSVDPLFRSIAQAYGAHALGVIMTGMGHDGLVGCEAMCAVGGKILAQDEETSVVWGMPGSVVRAGLADAVLPLSALAGEILRRVQVGRSSVLTRVAHEC